MNFDVTVNGRPWKIAIEPLEGSEFTVVVKGKGRVVDASWIDAETLSLIDGSVSREVRFHPSEAGSLGVAFDGKIFDAVVSAGQKATRDRQGDVAAATIKAPMPGRILRVLVAVGERVAAQQAVVIIEAMKMENELRSPKDGVVKEVAVTAGAAVDAGAVLVVIE